MKKFFLQNKIILAGVFYAIAACLLVYFLIIPMVKNIQQLSVKIQENLADQEAENRRLSQIPKMEEDLKEIKSRGEVLNVTLKPENEIEFIENIEAIAIRSGCVIVLNIGERIDPEEIKKIKKQNAKKGVVEKGIMDEITSENYFPMQINLKGNYSGLVDFVKMLENSQIYVNVISMRIAKEKIEKKDASQSPFSEKPAAEESQSDKEILNTVINSIVYIQ